MNLSNPLKRGIQTSELAVVVAADVALAAVPVLQGGLSPHMAATLGTVLTSVYVASRAVVKGMAALNQEIGLPAPPAVVSKPAPAPAPAPAAPAADVLTASPESAVTPDGDATTASPVPATPAA